MNTNVDQETIGVCKSEGVDGSKAMSIGMNNNKVKKGGWSETSSETLYNKFVAGDKSILLRFQRNHDYQTKIGTLVP